MKTTKDSLTKCCLRNKTLIVGSVSLGQSSMRACVLSCFSHVQLFATEWTVTHQAPLSMGFSRQEYWSGLPCPPTVASQPTDQTCTSFVSCTGRQVHYH